MNPIFLILVFTGGFVAWCVMNPLFKLIGGFLVSMMNDIKRSMSLDSNERDNEEDE